MPHGKTEKQILGAVSDIEKSRSHSYIPIELG